jgi:hypothetical protein
MEWFHTTLGFSYKVEEQGLPADWLLDLVSTGFHNSLHSYGFENVAQLQEASKKFVKERMGQSLPDLLASMKESTHGSVAPGSV